MRGAKRARASMVATLAHWSRRAVPASCSIWRCSAAKDLTTRTPLTFSSTMVASSAWRAWLIHDRGKMRSRRGRPSR